MSDDVKELYCAKDGTKADAYADVNAPRRVECPTCKQTDTFSNAVADAVRAALQSTVGSALQGSGSITAENGPPPHWVMK